MRDDINFKSGSMIFSKPDPDPGISSFIHLFYGDFLKRNCCLFYFCHNFKSVDQSAEIGYGSREM